MINIAYALLILLSLQEKEDSLDNDLFHLSRLFFLAESISEINQIKTKIERIEAAGKIREDNKEEVLLLKKEIDHLLNTDSNNQLEFIGLANRFNAIYLTRIKSQQDYINKYAAIFPIEKKISARFGEDCVISWIYKLKLLDIDCCLVNDKISIADLKRIISVFENKYGQQSLFLGDLYWYLVLKQIKIKDYVSVKQNCEKLRILWSRYTGDGSRRSYCLQIYTAKFSVELGDYDGARKIISSMNLDKLYDLGGNSNYELYLYNSSASRLSDKINRLDNAIVFSEAGLSYLERALNKDHPDVLGEAQKLRELFLRKGDLVSVRKLENQYKIKPVAAKQPGEK